MRYILATKSVVCLLAFLIVSPDLSAATEKLFIVHAKMLEHPALRQPQGLKRSTMS